MAATQRDYADYVAAARALAAIAELIQPNPDGKQVWTEQSLRRFVEEARLHLTVIEETSATVGAR